MVRCSRGFGWVAVLGVLVFGCQTAKDAGENDATWARRDPDLALLHGDPDFEKLYPRAPE